MSSRLQLAAAVAYCAVFFRGSVQIKSADGCLQLGTEDSVQGSAFSIILLMITVDFGCAEGFAAWGWAQRQRRSGV